LEDALIIGFDPAWNGRIDVCNSSGSSGREIEDESFSSVVANPGLSNPPMQARAQFEIRLGDTYYERGIINPGIDASRFLGRHGDPLLVCLGDCDTVVASRINRTANSSGGVRIAGGNQHIASWFQQHFKRGDVVQASVLDEGRILLHGSGLGG
jgi:hypothetical protein